MTGQGRKAAPPKPVPALSGQEAEDEEIARFYAEHKEALRSYLITGCGCPAADADDIIQDTILAIRKRYWPKVRTLDKPQAYWFKAAERRYRRLAGRQARRIDGADPETRLLGVAHPLDQFAAVDRREDLKKIIARLPRRQRQVLWLRKALDFSEAETAEILGITTGSVKTHLHHGKHQAEKLLPENKYAIWKAGIR